MAEGRNKVVLKGVGREAVVGGMEINYEEMAKYTFSELGLPE